MMPPTPPAPPRPDLAERPIQAVHDVPWRWWHALAVYLLTSLVLSIAVLPFMGDELMEGTGLGLVGIVATVVTDLVFVAVLIGWLRWRTRQWREAVLLDERDRWLRTFGVGFSAGLLLAVVVLFGVSTALVIVFRALTGETVSAPDQLSPDLSTGAQVLAAILAVGVAPLVEELFFRGILFRSLRRHGLWVAAVVSSIFFGVVHYVGGPAPSALFLMTATAFTGLGLALIYEWRGLVASIGAHVAFNAIGVVLIFSLG
jgi:membrane protease YdiL (CAAX protease family)